MGTRELVLLAGLDRLGVSGRGHGLLGGRVGFLVVVLVVVARGDPILQDRVEVRLDL